jgi:signal transduction histidine kinase
MPELDARASIAIIVAAIGLIGWIQYSWFSQAAAVEIEDAYRSLNATVMQTLSREYQRYAPLLSDLRALSDKGSVTEAEARSRLERAFSQYGPAGSEPGLLASVGLASSEDPSVICSLGPDGSWTMGPSALALPFPDQAKRQLIDRLLLENPEGPPGLWRMVFSSDGGSKPRQFIIARAGEGSIASLELDTAGFLEDYVKPAVSGLLPGAKIEWSAAERPEQGAGNPRGGAAPRRGFNPIKALLGIESSERRTFEVFVPAAMDSYIFRRSVGGAGSQRQIGDFQYRPLQVEEDPRPSERDQARAAPEATPDARSAIRMISARILVSPGSAVGSMERRLSLNWLMSELLLAGLGAAFSLAVIQSRRNDVMRKREREFVASVTHELRTPVTAIRSAADNLRRGLVGQDRLEIYGEMIHGQSLRLGSMIEEVLLFSQVEGGKSLPPALAAVRPAELARELCPPLDAIARSEGVEVEWDFGSLPSEFLCDAEAVRLIIANLVANALYHAYPGEQKGAVRVTGKSLLPDAIQFSVEDDGLGIGRKESALVFEAFYRGEASRSRHEKGSGLGLFIARRKARLLGGELRLESPYERIDGAKRPGCRFVLEFPLKEPGDAR